MARLNQIIAVANGKKAASTAVITEIYKVLQFFASSHSTSGSSETIYN